MQVLHAIHSKPEVFSPGGANPQILNKRTFLELPPCLNLFFLLQNSQVCCDKSPGIVSIQSPEV